MFNHERFRKLVALASIGQLSPRENRELEEHLRECQECCGVQEDYSRIIFHELPKADPIGPHGRVGRCPGPDGGSRDRFLARAFTEGIEFSRDIQQAPFLQISRSRRSWQWRQAVAVAALAFITFVGILAGRRYKLVPRVSATNPVSIHQILEPENLRAQLSILRKITEQQSAELHEIGRKSSVSDDSLRKLRGELESEQKRAVGLSAELSQSVSSNSDFARSDLQKDLLIADLRAQNDVLNRERAANLSNLAIQEVRIHQLAQSLQEEHENIERERQLLSVSNDVRQLMGARNLHIIDVLDVNAGGGSTKAFGRVFYAEGQSLIFYAFDLPSSRLSAAKYTFHAWGQAEARPEFSRELGVFEVDNHDQRRWVLKMSDSKMLTGIDSVFVTAESLGEAKEPHGKKLLYAYIGGQPNHP
jgi:hypothetical protein